MKKERSESGENKASGAESLAMPIVNRHAAGIDVGSKSHYLAVGQRSEDVYEFDVTTSGHMRAIDILHRHQVTTVAMESTGTYWQPLFNTLQAAGFEVLLVNGVQTKSLRGKTDVRDSRRIQLLHSLGLLSGSFLPESAVLALRTITRHRSSLTEAHAKYLLKVQKCLRLMNIRLDVAIRDVAGKTGSAIVTAILMGERDAQALADLADPRVKRSQAELVDLLQGQWDNALLYELRDCWELMAYLNRRIEACDKEISGLLAKYEPVNKERNDIQQQKIGRAHV